HPACTVDVRGNAVVTCDPHAVNVAVTPAGALSWNVALVKGQTDPVPQGWYSEHYGRFEPATCAEFEAEVASNATFAWLIMPGSNPSDGATIQLVSDRPEEVVVRVAFPHDIATQLKIPLVGDL